MILNGFLQSIAKLNQLPINKLPISDCSLYETIKEREYFSNGVVTKEQSCTEHQGEWLFYPGMLFGSCDKWWADWGTRYTPHEGLDITFYRKKIDDAIRSDNSSCGCDILSFDSSVVIPAMFDGTVLNICKDFLGQSVVIRHQALNQVLSNNRNSCCNSYSYCDSNIGSIGNLTIKDDKDSEIVFVYSHILAESGLNVGQMVKKGQIIGNVADTSMRKSGIPSHLHISIAEVLTKIAFADLNWELFADPVCDSVCFFDPMRI